VKKPLILVSNDDGVNAKGLHELIDIVKDLGEVIVVAPEKGESGMSHAISIKMPLRLNKVSEKDNVTIYSVPGTPVDCVKLALNKVVERKPDIVVSGINHGSNASISVIYSGTMGAAIEGCLNRIPSVGFSLTSHHPDADFSTSRKYIKKIVLETLQNSLPDGVCLNVNFPANGEVDYKGIKVCRQTKGVWKEEYEKRVDPHKQTYYWLTGSFNNFEPEAEDTDEWALENNYAAVVPIQVDFTAFDTIKTLKNLENEN
jgi:5'/3'-nucleotidase